MPRVGPVGWAGRAGWFHATRAPWSPVASYSGGMIEVGEWPELHAPVMVVALTGWVDAGMAGAGALAALHAQLDDARTFGRLDLADLTDLTETRPTVRLVDGVTREIEWPSIELVSGHLGGDVVLVAGTEPSARWRAVVADLVDVASRLGVSAVYTLGGMPASVSHRRPVRVLATAGDPDRAREVGALRLDYTGPIGLATVLQVELGRAPVPVAGVGLWAQVPHYVSANASPAAVSALLARLRVLTGLDIDARVLDEAGEAYRARLEEELAERPDVAEIVHTLDKLEDPGHLPTGDELATEIERFLREQH